MPTSKQWIILNIFLAIVVFLLLADLAGVQLPSVGQAAYALDQGEAACAVQWKEQLTAWTDIDQCCLQARQQLQCISEKNKLGGQQLDYACFTGESVRYLLSSKAYKYCKVQPIW